MGIKGILGRKVKDYMAKKKAEKEYYRKVYEEEKKKAVKIRAKQRLAEIREEARYKAMTPKHKRIAKKIGSWAEKGERVSGKAGKFAKKFDETFALKGSGVANSNSFFGTSKKKKKEMRFF